MNTMSSRQHLELSVSNFGPIAEGRIELRPMTVFVGPSNTGKSYLATLIYTLHRFFVGYSDRSRHLFGRRTYERPPATIPITSPAPSADDIARLKIWVVKTSVSDEVGEQYIRPSDLPADIARLVHPVISNIQHLTEVLDGEVARCFGVNDLANLVRHPADNTAKISLSGNVISALGDDARFEYGLTLAESQSSLRASIPPAMALQTGRDLYFPWQLWLEENEDEKDDWARALLAGIARAVVSNIVGPFRQPAYYLPADRAGVMHAHQLAVRGLIAGASRAFLRQDMPMPVLSGVLGDFMEQLVALAGDPPFQRRQGGKDLAAGLEQALLRGEIRIERSEIDYPSFIYRPESWKRDLPLMNASSMVSELAPVALYLRHIVRPGDTLIIEEPESHLHPEMQVAFLRQLAAAVKAGVRIIITTHSEWVLEELANLVLMSELPPERRMGIDGADVVLSPDEFGAWFFEPGADGAGSTVREMPLDKDLGNFPSGFALITEDTYNRWAQIFNRIEDCQE